MSDLTRFEDSWRRVLEANTKYYQALGAIARDYVSAMSSVWREAIPPLRIALPARVAAHPALSPTSAPSRAAPAPALVLEAAGGQEARAAFAVFNELAREVSAPVTVSPLRDERGHEGRVSLSLLPGLVTLAPGTRGVVEVRAAITDSLDADVGYYGTITVPELTTGTIAVVVRRLTSGRVPPSAAPAAGRTAVRRRNTKTKKAATRRA